MHTGLVRCPPHKLAFATAIQAARIEAGRTEADVAAEAGLPLRTVQRRAGTQARVTLGDAAATALAFGRSLDELVKVLAAATFEPPQMGRPRRADRL